MDSSNRHEFEAIEFIKGFSQLYTSEITPEEWVEILKYVAYEINPIFKYLNSRPLATVLNGSWAYTGGEHNGKRVTKESLINNPAKISLKARCIELHYDFQIDDTKYDRRKWRGLFLLEHDKFVRWEGRYDRVDISTDRALSCILTELDDKTLAEYVGDRKWSRSTHPGRDILDRLSDEWGKLINERQRYLDSIRDAQRLVDGMLQRMSH